MAAPSTPVGDATGTPPELPWVQTLGGSALDPRIQPQCSLAVQLRRVTGSVVGRAAEMAAIDQELRDARTNLSAVTLEGEPGIGKTRLLLAAAELAARTGFTGPVRTLIDAGVVKSRRLTSYHSIQTDLKNAGAEWLDQEVVEDDNLVTSRSPDDLPAFNQKIIEKFQETAKTERPGEYGHEMAA